MRSPCHTGLVASRTCALSFIPQLHLARTFGSHTSTESIPAPRTNPACPSTNRRHVHKSAHQPAERCRVKIPICRDQSPATMDRETHSKHQGESLKRTSQPPGKEDLDPAEWALNKEVFSQITQRFGVPGWTSLPPQGTIKWNTSYPGTDTLPGRESMHYSITG